MGQTTPLVTQSSDEVGQKCLPREQTKIVSILTCLDEVG